MNPHASSKKVLHRMESVSQPNRTRMPSTRPGYTEHGEHVSEYGTIDYYVTVNFYDDPDGGEGERFRPGEVFVVIAKSGSDLRRAVDGWAVAVSLALQSGVPWEAIAKHYINGAPPKHIYESVCESIMNIVEHRKQIVGE